MNGMYRLLLLPLFLPIHIFSAEAAPSDVEIVILNRALVHALESCNETKARKLIQQGARINQKVLTNTHISYGGITPSNGESHMECLPLLDHLLVRLEHEPEKRAASIRLLFTLGGNSDTRNTFGRTPLFYAPTGELAQLFIEHGCPDLNYSDHYGRRALHEAMWHGRADVVQVLLARGASPTIQDHAQRTPLDLIFFSSQEQYRNCKALIPASIHTQAISKPLLPFEVNFPYPSIQYSLDNQ